MIGIFGSAFNPPTRGHLGAISQALEACEEVWLVPAIAHAFGKDMLPFETRLSMTKAFAREVDGGRGRVHVCEIEESIWDGENPVYTIDVLSTLQSHHPDKEFAFVVGPDNMRSFNRFKSFEDILSQWRLVSASDQSGIRSTLVRKSCAKQQGIHSMVTPSIERFIIKEGLYGR